MSVDAAKVSEQACDHLVVSKNKVSHLKRGVVLLFQRRTLQTLSKNTLD